MQTIHLKYNRVGPMEVEGNDTICYDLTDGKQTTQLFISPDLEEDEDELRTKLQEVGNLIWLQHLFSGN